jgi:hypothetical protein
VRLLILTRLLFLTLLLMLLLVLLFLTELRLRPVIMGERSRLLVIVQPRCGACKIRRALRR